MKRPFTSRERCSSPHAAHNLHHPLHILAGYFIQKYNREMGRTVNSVSANALEMLKAHDWPGNIRQLRNAIGRAMLFADEDTLDVEHFSLGVK